VPAARALLRIPTERRLFDSLDQACKRALVEAGFQIHGIDESQRGAILFAYCRILHRSISVKPRVVERSREFQAQMDAESSASLRAQVEAIDSEMRQGLNLNVRLSRKFYDAPYNDPLLNDLGVHHFHLGERAVQPGKLCKTTQELLFGVVDESTVRLVHLGDHVSFRKIAFEQIMFDNWPRLFTATQWIMPTSEPLATEERATARHGGLTIPIELNGKVYMAPWSGQSSAGASSWAISSADRLVDQVRGGREWVLERAPWILENLTKRGRTDPTLPLEVHIEGLTVWFVDRVQGIWMCPATGELRFTNIVAPVAAPHT
jgi:hypothetical protein